MNLIDEKYLIELSPILRNFKKQNERYVCSCPICGDSLKNKRKTRGNFFDHNSVLLYHCYNCNASMSFSNFLKLLDQNMFNSYLTEIIFDKMKVKNTNKKIKEKYNFNTPMYLKDGPLKHAIKISSLHHEDKYKKYIINRKIPNKYHSKLFLVYKFNNFVNEYLIKDKFSEELLKRDEPRLIIPLINKNDDLHGIQGRSFNTNSDLKYITIVTNETIPKIYGLDTVNFNGIINVFEGPIDSMFIENSISTCGGDLSTIPLNLFNKEKLRIIYDNEPRQIHTINKIEKSIDNGFNVVIFPENIKSKDINKMIIDGYSIDELEQIIKNNTFSGLKAKLELSKWRKI